MVMMHIYIIFVFNINFSITEKIDKNIYIIKYNNKAIRKHKFFNSKNYIISFIMILKEII